MKRHTECYRCGQKIERKKFVKYCQKCRETYGQYVHHWPTEDEKIEKTDSLIIWTKIKLYHNLRKNPLTGVPVICGNCGLERIVPCSNVRLSRQKYGRFTGYCQRCIGNPVARQKLGHMPFLKKNGRSSSGGYIFVNIRTIPQEDLELIRPMLNKAGRGNYIAEHRLVVAKRIGRPLGEHERVHHLNGIKTDNRDSNLMLTNVIEHNHIETRIYLELKRELDKAKETIKGLHRKLREKHGQA